MSNDTEYTNLILEEIRGQNKVVIEAVGQMQEKIETLATQESLDRLAVKVSDNSRTCRCLIVENITGWFSLFGFCRGVCRLWG